MTNGIRMISGIRMIYEIIDLSI